MNSLTSFSTFGLNARAKHVEHFSSVDDLTRLIQEVGNEPFIVLGQGSNTVFVEDFDGTVLVNAVRGIEHQLHGTDQVLRVGAGENWHDLVVWTLGQGILGLENLALIPGTVGAAPIQNIGAYGVEVSRFIDGVTYLELSSGKTETLNREACQFGYRESIFKGTLSGRVVITEVMFRFPAEWKPNCAYGELASLSEPTPIQIFDKVVEIRKSKLPDPEKIGNAGSFFKNPTVDMSHYLSLADTWPDMPCFPVSDDRVKIPAAWMIDRLGFKGKGVGGIRCHVSQPLVLTNDGTGTGEQLLQLARQIRDSVSVTFSISLENEVRLIGKQGLVAL